MVAGTTQALVSSPPRLARLRRGGALGLLLLSSACFYDPVGSAGASDGTTTSSGTTEAPLPTTGSTSGAPGSTGGSTSAADTSGIDGTTAPPVPMSPTLTLDYAPIKRFVFSWAPADGADSYQLLERLPGAVDYVLVADDLAGTSTSLTVPLHLRYGASYVLRGCNDGGCAESSPVAATGTMAAAIGYVKASNPDPDDRFGWHVALSADGSTLAVGASDESSAAVGIDGDQSNDAAQYAGAVYIFTRDGDAWSQQAYVKAFDSFASDRFGSSLALSATGDTLVVGAPGENSSATGIDGDQDDNGANSSGAVYVFQRKDGAWSQQAYVKASNATSLDHFGTAVALAADGNTLAVGAPDEDSAAKGVDGDQADESMSESGAVYVFRRIGSYWMQQSYIKAHNPEASDFFGEAVALSGDGKTLAVGVPKEDSSAIGIGGDALDNAAFYSGAVYVFAYANNAWAQQAYVKASNTGAVDEFGRSVALSFTGDTLAVGAPGESSAAGGVDGEQHDNSLGSAGAVYVFARSGNAWSQQSYIKAAHPGYYDHFGSAVALSGAGDVLAVGAGPEKGAAVGLGGDENDDAAEYSGAAYVFIRPGEAWSQAAYIKAPNTDAFDFFGHHLALSADASTLAVGAYGEAGAAMGIGGDQRSDAAPKAGAVYLY